MLFCGAAYTKSTVINVCQLRLEQRLQKGPIWSKVCHCRIWSHLGMHRCHGCSPCSHTRCICRCLVCCNCQAAFVTPHDHLAGGVRLHVTVYSMRDCRGTPPPCCWRQIARDRIKHEGMQRQPIGMLCKRAVLNSGVLPQLDKGFSSGKRAAQAAECDHRA